MLFAALCPQKKWTRHSKSRPSLGCFHVNVAARADVPNAINTQFTNPLSLHHETGLHY
jgi:hypothetical protein